MPAVKKYTRINFQNYPSTSTPLNATNLNKMDKGIDDLDDEVVAVKNTIENMSFDADAISYDNTQSGLQATDVQGAVDEINDNLSGFKFYPAGTGIVGLIADDSAYTDEDGNYVVWGTATANQLVEDNPNTYKSVPSEEETHGEVGADTATPFSKEAKIFDLLYIQTMQAGSLYTITNELDVDIKNMLFPLPIYTQTQVKVNDEIATFEKIAIPYAESYATYDLVKLPIKKGDKLQVQPPQYSSSINYPFIGIKSEVEVLATYKHPNSNTTSVFTADKDYEELYVYISGGYMGISNYSSNIYPHPIVPISVGGSAGWFYRFNNVKSGNTITFYNQYSQNANIACVFKLV